MEKLLISIITVSYNSRATIADTIRSVALQTNSNIEQVIIDGSSTDNTLEIVKNTPNRITKIISEPDKGIYDAMNKGIALAKGDIIGFLHSDDMLASPETLQNIANAFSSSNPELGRGPDVVYGDLVFVDQNDTNKVVRYWKSRPFKPDLLKRGWMPPHPTVFMRREVYEKHGLFNIDLKCAADYDYILRVFRDQTLTVSYLPEVITKMRMGGASTGGIKNLINKSKEDYWVLKNNHMQFPLLVLFAKNISKLPQLIFKKHKTHYSLSWAFLIVG